MQTTARRHGRASSPRRPIRPPRASTGLIHPVVIYPFQSPDDFRDLEPLYDLVARLAARPDTYARPITVMDRKTYFRQARRRQFMQFRARTIARCSDLLDAWCVDTCQMWYAGLGMAFEQGGPGDVYWLIPGDFNYGSRVGQEVLGRLHDLPEICAELDQDVCIGEIAADHNNPKQLIDTYGTFALLYQWFPDEAREIRQFTQRPRSEFFAIRHPFLSDMLNRRWFAYEQTVVILLHAVRGRKQISRFSVGDISDLPEGRESLASALLEVERIERVLKTLWREQHESDRGWSGVYRRLEERSEEVRRTAFGLLETLLR
ncbi:MAG TPA: hypothetical protein P5555_06220 [Candidatus Paceibacterota bacterium]|nr:hypothetical protein [Verrucomicrobiota bacterium]HOX04084.1 hypothetical protein [Verrucomicrobiota bacterium]HRZ44767.1 hypothetical protein [Candidatus Paceibacterota bacterium]HRZ92257.1 hypothetical protein [Candidatus Paceibacterota bacterium]